MKNFTVLLLSIITYTFAFAQPEQNLFSTIDKVTVFLQGAQITRTAETSLNEGVTTLVFNDLSSTLDPSTIQIKQEGDFVILAVNHRRNYGDTLFQSTNFQLLRDSIGVITNRIWYLKTLQNILKEEEEFLQQGRPSNHIDNQFNAEVYKNASTYYAERIREIRLENLDIERQLRVLKDKFQQNHKAINEKMGERKDYPSEVVVKVKSERTIPAKLSLTYLTPNASWTPSYDLKVETIAQPIALVYKANLVQSTGEDWKNVLLTFSNADPSKSGVLPDLRPNYLNYGKRYASATATQPRVITRPDGSRVIKGIITDDNGEALIGANILVKGASTGTVTDFDGNFEMEVPEGISEVMVSYTGYRTKNINLNELGDDSTIMLEDGMNLSEVVVTRFSKGRKKAYSEPKQQRSAPPSTVNQKQTTVEFTLDTPYSVRSDGENYTIVISQGEMDAKYEYRSIPKLEEAAYLNAKIANWTVYNLMSGEINLYFENTFIGKSELDTGIPSDTLEISLGRDQNVQILRTPIEEFRKRNFVGNKQIDSRAYRISVRNGKSQPVYIEILDQIPISKNKDINVDDIEISGGLLNEENGQVKWILQLEANEEQNKTITYSVKYPKGGYVIID